MEQKTEASQAVDEQACIEWAERFYRNDEWFESTELSVAINAWAHACAYTRAALKAQPAPTEAARDRIPMPTNADQAELMQKLGLAWLQTNAPDRLTDAGRAAQGEDSARLDWKRITAPGQVKVGDKLRFTIGDEKFSERVKQIINPGYPDEELIYNKRRNFYVITSNAITNFGSSKNVEFRARASAEKGGVKP